MVAQIVGYELRANRGGSMVNCRVRFRQVERSDHKEVDVSAGTDSDPGGGLGGEGRIIKSNIGLCVGQERKYC